MGVIRNHEKISYTIDTKLVNFYCNNLRKTQILTLKTRIFVFFAHFRVFILILDLCMWVIWMPQNIFDTLDIKFVDFYCRDLIKI